ncbi:MAG: energy-coupling factor ABC transporter permease [Xanthomonadaceae bacterium]|nr:energy-coupling factor ABC transporter permease [Xanthomonadaceae bacterium]
MNVALSPEGRWLGVAIAGIILAWAAWRLPWDKVRGDAEAQRIFAIFIAVIILLRAPSTQSVMGINLHFLGASIATLMFGARFALIALAVVSAAWALLGRVWLGWGWDFIANDALPVAVTAGVGALVVRYLPAHIFIYIFGNAFFAAGLAMLSSITFKAIVTVWLGGDAASYAIAAIPMAFGEAFFTGGAMALIVVYRPQWCASFDDARYLTRRD